MANIKLGYAPTRRSIFSAPDAIKYRGLTADRLTELGIDFVDITDVNEEGLLYVLIGKAQQFANLTLYIDNDNVLAGKEATDYLYKLGHRKIAYLGSESIKLFSADRKTGYQLSMLQNDLAVNSNYIIEVEGVYLDECEPLQRLLTSEDRPTAIVVSDDILAVSLERVCILCGLSIPEDLSIISFNDSLFA